MTVHMTRGQTVNLNELTAQSARQAPVKVESTRDAVKRNDLNAVYKAIKVFGVR